MGKKWEAIEKCVLLVFKQSSYTGSFGKLISLFLKAAGE